MAITVAEIIVYPVKSLAGISVHSAQLETRGLQHDRRWAVVSATGTVLTAREHPSMLALHTELVSAGVKVTNPAGQSIDIPFSPAHHSDESFAIFSGSVSGYEVDPHLNTFFSDHLGETCRLMGISDQAQRPVQARHGGKPGDFVAFADDCPLLLTNQASLADLNQHIGETIPMRQLRPNIVVAGPPAWSEQYWQALHVNRARFEVAQQCKRCNLATINPDTHQFHTQQEPLRTLARTRPRFRNGVAFGIHLMPRELPVEERLEIRVGDVVESNIG